MIKSPCINKCKVMDNNICKSCGRTLVEINAWSYCDDREKAVIVYNAECRLKWSDLELPPINLFSLPGQDTKIVDRVSSDKWDLL